MKGLVKAKKKGTFIDDLANELWALGIPQAGGHFDYDKFTSCLPAPKFPKRSAMILQGSALILVVPFITVKALCYWLGVHIDERLYFPDDEHGLYRSNQPYWLEVEVYYNCLHNVALERGYETRLTVEEGLFVLAQTRGGVEGLALEGTMHDDPQQRYFLKLVHGRPTLTSENVERISYRSLYGHKR